MEILEHVSARSIKKTLVAIIGFTVLIVGIAMIVLPGPAFIIIPLGLAILGNEFPWARRLLERIRDRISEAKGKNHGREAE